MTASENPRQAISIRQIQNRDWPKVTFGSKRWGAPPFVGQELVRLMMKDDTATTIAEDEKKRIVGYAVVQKERDNEDEYRIVTLAVDHDFRRQGVGTDLVNHAISLIHWSRPGQDFSLNAKVHEDDVDSQQFFSSCGLRADPKTAHASEMVMQRGLLTLEEKAFLAAEKLGSVTGVPWEIVRKQQDGSMTPVDTGQRIKRPKDIFFKTTHALEYPVNACDILTKLGCRQSELLGPERQSGAAYIALPFGALDAIGNIDLQAGTLADDFAQTHRNADAQGSDGRGLLAERELAKRTEGKRER